MIARDGSLDLAEKTCKVRLGYRMQSMSRAANNRRSYARRVLELAPACVSPGKTSARRRGEESRFFRIESVAVE